MTLAKGRAIPTWVLNLPARPRVDGADLLDTARVAGTTNDGGVWRCDEAKWVHWTDRDGGLWLTAPLPAPKCLRVVGGPARKLVLKDDRYAGRTYVGGDADSFERLIIPAERHGARNAWYRLGEPTLLGPEFGKTPHWGRIEIEPTQHDAPIVFLTVLITDRADAERAPTVDYKSEDDGIVVRLRAGDDQATLRLPSAAQTGGAIELGGSRPVTWTLPSDVQPDEPLPTVRER